MADILKVTPEKLISAASEFSSTDSQVQATTNEMNNLINGLSGIWTGEASEAFKNKFNQLNDDMTRIHSMINEHAKDLQEMAQIYIDAENKNAEISGALAGDVIQ